MTPEAFIAKWKAADLKEKSASQEHFIDLCHLLGQPTPAEADPKGTWYCFERGATKAGGGDGWADVWRRGFFGWEYKGKGKDLKAALKQLQLYALALESPPLLIVSDIESIVIHTAFTNAVPMTYTLSLDDLADPDRLRWLRWAFADPERLKPGKTIPELTEEAAGRFADLAQSLGARGHDPQRVAHFLNKLLFCLFAEDVELLPRQLFTRLLENGLKAPEHLSFLLQGLFHAMAGGGPFGVEVIDWFNGGLFDGDDTLPLEKPEIQTLLEAARLDWSAIEPSIFGTLFERGLDPAKRSQLGAHYTDRQSIMRLIDPVIREPLLAEWESCKAAINELLRKESVAKTDKKKREKEKEWSKTAHGIYAGFLHRLEKFRILDPACGSGNFLYLALQTLKDLEHRVMLEAEALGLARQFPSVGPECVHGIELNPYAAELARVTVWIGEIQWMLKHGYSLNRNPILRPLETIEQRDALINPDGTEANWPKADAIVGNPPFLGDKKMLGELGEDYVTRIRRLFKGRVPGGADLVTYWFDKARVQIETGAADRGGLVATNSIRGGANRKVLDAICASRRIFNAWSDEPWVNEGAAVRVSLVCFGSLDAPSQLNGAGVEQINSDLTGGSADLTRAKRLASNKSCCFYATVKAGRFDVDGLTARSWLKQPNPHVRPNSDVVKPWANAIDVTRRPEDKWVVDFGTAMAREDASLYELPFAHVLAQVKPIRDKTRRDKYRNIWWLFAEPIPGMRNAVRDLTRYIATPAVAKHRLFVWVPATVVPDHALMVVARSDDTTFGILHSRLHELWALGTCTWLGKGNDPRYTPTTTFETFPFPEGLTPADTAPKSDAEKRELGYVPVIGALDDETIRPNEPGIHPQVPVLPDPARRPLARAIAEAAFKLNRLRENWLNPPEWTDRIPEVVPGFPDRIIPKPGHETDLKKRTLTNLYNQRPAWLDHAHKVLDAAVADAYGWNDYTHDMPDQEVLRRLLELNLARSKENGHVH